MTRPWSGGRRLKVLYGAQVQTRPPRFRLTVNDRRLVTRDYAYFLENQLRERLGLAGSPVIIDFVSRWSEPLAGGLHSRPMLMSVPARYDGFASWYDERLLPYTMAASDSIERLLGPGSGRCLDLCCGTGAHLQTLVALGWHVTGVDISEDQLRLAGQRAGYRRRAHSSGRGRPPAGRRTIRCGRLDVLPHRC